MTEQFLRNIDELTEAHLKDSFKGCTAAQLGLDPRSGYGLYAGDQYIVVNTGSEGSLEYYGGFQYVAKDCKTTVGSYTFYSAMDERVSECLDRFFEVEEVE